MKNSFSVSLFDLKNYSRLRYKAKSKAKSFFVSLFHIVLIATMSYMFLFPLYYSFIMAFQKPDLAVDPTTVYVPKAFSFDAIKVAYKELNYTKSASLTLITTLFSTLFALISCSITGYAFARFNFRGKKIAFLFVLLLIIIPPQQIIVPQYMLYQSFTFGGLFSLFGMEFNLLDTPLVFVLPALFAVGLKSGVFIFVFRQFFSGQPKELEEAAKIDGCGAFKTFYKVMVPLAKPAFVVVAMLSIIWHWNDYYSSAMFFVGDLKPLIIELEYFRYNITADGGLVLLEGLGKSNIFIQRMYLQAAVLLTIFPPLLLFIFMQKYFVESIERTGIVG